MISLTGRTRKEGKYIHVEIRCECGKKKWINKCNLLRTESCGCLRWTKAPPLGKLKSFQHGRLYVFEQRRNADSQIEYNVRCDCGVEKWISKYNLKRTHSCGCLNRELAASKAVHGHCRKRGKSGTYSCWANMWSRCTNTNVPAYKNYGARGITVCEAWRSFEQFLEDMGECPPGHEIDRLNNDDGYFPSNCRWVLPKTNSINKRNNIVVTYQGRTQVLSVWCEELQLPYKSTWRRIAQYGWTASKAFKTPFRRKAA